MKPLPGQLDLLDDLAELAAMNQQAATAAQLRGDPETYEIYRAEAERLMRLAIKEQAWHAGSARSFWWGIWATTRK